MANVEWLFTEFHALYGEKLARMWDTGAKSHDEAKKQLDRIKHTWAEDLSGYRMGEIRRGLDACRKHPWPPTLPEFMLMCRPKPDYEAMFRDAQEQTYKRRYGSDNWKSRVQFWAANRIGPDDMLNLPWEKVKTRWIKVVDELIPREDDLPRVPESRTLLSHTPKDVSDVARNHISQCRQILGMEAA